MFKINLKLDDRDFKTVTYSNKRSIEEIIAGNNLPEYVIVAYTLNSRYVDSQYEIKEDVCLNLVSVRSEEGYRIYQDTAIFVLMKSFYELFGSQSKIVVEHSIGDGIYAEKFGGSVLSAEDIEKLEARMKEIISKRKKIEKLRVTSDRAKEIFSRLNRKDILANIVYKDIDIYKSDDFYDYYLRQLADNTGVINGFELIYQAPGVIIRFPDKKDFRIKGQFEFSKNLFQTHQEHDKWLKILRVHDVGALNKAIKNYEIIDLIQVEEALHEKKIVDFADEIIRNKNTRIVLVSGPSSSGKTTFAKRLSTHLRVNGILPSIIGIDDYFLPRNLTPRTPQGDYDFESIDAIDNDLLNKHLAAILNGEEVEIPKFNFIDGNREKSYRKISLKSDEILILEGIHVLNDKLTFSVPYNQKVKIYVSALNNLNIDAHNRIPTNDIRKIRRIVRDAQFRGYTIEQTLSRWNLVIKGDNENIFPFQEIADYMFNSTLTYELGVLKKYLLPLLKRVNDNNPHYMEVRRLNKLIDHIYNILDEYVPTNSILREFIGGGVFKY